MLNNHCLSCNKSTPMVFDCLTNKSNCSECGSNNIFYNIQQPEDTKGPTKDLTTKTTEIISSSSGEGSKLKKRSCTKKIPGSVYTINNMCNSISEMADRLGLTTTIKDHALEVYNKLKEEKYVYGRKLEAIAVACLYIACRKEKNPRTVKELCSVVTSLTKPDVTKILKVITKHREDIGELVEMGATNIEEYLKHFCAQLEMTSEGIKATHEAVKNTKELLISKSPLSLVAAVLFTVIQILDHKKTPKDIADVTGITEWTLKYAFKELQPHLPTVIPGWFANEQKLQTLKGPNEKIGVSPRPNKFVTDMEL